MQRQLIEYTDLGVDVPKLSDEEKLDKLDREIKQTNRIYACHKYFGRKPWHPISLKIKQHSNDGDTVFDPFLGSGVTALESIFLRRSFIGIDLNPMSKFITEGTIDLQFDSKVFEAELQTITTKMSNLVNDLYLSNTPCKQCGRMLMLTHINNGPRFEQPYDCKFYCEACGRHSRKAALKRKANALDMEKMNKSYPISKWVPETEFPKKFHKDRFSYKGITKVKQMYTPRNLFFLSELLHEIENGKYNCGKLFLLAFSNTVLHASHLKSENARPLNTNNYWVPDDRFEENPWMRFLDRVNLVRKSKQELIQRFGKQKPGDANIITGSSLKVELEDSSIDYIITDPPYGEAIQYFELSFIWNAWRRTEYDSSPEVIINPKQNKSNDDFIGFIEQSVKECARILKPGGKYTLCFQNKEFKIWNGVLKAFAANDFQLIEVDIVELHGEPLNNHWANFSPSADIYITFQLGKYMPSTEEPVDVLDIISECVELHPDASVPDLYNHVIRRLIQEVYVCQGQAKLDKLTIKSLVSMMEEAHERN